MKITDDEREAAWELQFHITEVLREQQRARLYAEVYIESVRRGVEHTLAATRAKIAIEDMEQAFAPQCEACREQENIERQQKAN